MFNKPQTTKVNLSIRQVLHKATLFSYLSDLKTIINNDLLPEIQNLKKLQLQENSSFKECNARTVRLNEIVDSVRIHIFIINVFCIDLNTVKKFFTTSCNPIIVQWKDYDWGTEVRRLCDQDILQGEASEHRNHEPLGHNPEAW